MLRTVAKAFSASRILAATTTISRQTFHFPAISPAFPNLPSSLSKISILLFPPLLANSRGYARGRQVSDDDEDDYSGGDMDSKDFGKGGKGFSEDDDDDDEGLLDEEEDDEVEDESD